MIRSIIKLPKDLRIFLFQKRFRGPFRGENEEKMFVFVTRKGTKDLSHSKLEYYDISIPVRVITKNHIFVDDYTHTTFHQQFPLEKLLVINQISY